MRQNKGDEFVALVQIRQQKLAMVEGATTAFSVERNSSVERNGGLSSGSRQYDLSEFPSFQSVREMGYPESEIRESFNQLRATKDPEDITGMDLVEVILSKEDKNNGLDIPPPLYISKPTNEYQSRSSSLDQNTPDISQGGQFDAAIGPSPQKTSESGAQEKTQKNHEKDTYSLMKGNRKLRDLKICKICMENDTSITMLACGHLCCCADCAPAMRKCPTHTHFSCEKARKMSVSDQRRVNFVSSNSEMGGQEESPRAELWMKPGTGVLYLALVVQTVLRVAWAAAAFPVRCVISQRGSGNGCVFCSVYHAVATSLGFDSEYLEA